MKKNKVPKITDYFIDLGMGKKEVEKLISVGNPITRERGFIEMGDCFNCKSLDNRISVFILLELIKRLKNPTSRCVCCIYCTRRSWDKGG